MPNLASAVAALHDYCGFPAARVRTDARRLIEDKLIEPGAPGVAVEINPADFALLLLAVASGAPLRSVADITASLASCVPNGVDVGVMPEAIRPAKRTAFDLLHDLVWSPDNSPVTAIEVCESWPEVTFHTRDGIVRFQPAGALAGHWSGNKQRRATTVPASAIALAAKHLFGDTK
ncbi:MAG: hypothetical protein E5X80_05050 [Mesorhizobium sp.]|uniref:hypothetical protein n=1 Tax=Mesorhizobium sp. TaxID=1871066 RepID=UPI00120A434E|nr:hypothetical protein [Mesorhizobium sp.]TIO52966.1 MAG: hypothetical protein E5X78_09995 [Mesorhizobium sp.]TIO61799.1 MAG: hypothetical protein E5X79_05375 [Mesorhizobium sp.]TJV66746.1 MAG: hypothetical protein E5X80_05050 [Mesorhizobium sp.]